MQKIILRLDTDSIYQEIDVMLAQIVDCKAFNNHWGGIKTSSNTTLEKTFHLFVFECLYPMIFT